MQGILCTLACWWTWREGQHAHRAGTRVRTIERGFCDRLRPPAVAPARRRECRMLMAAHVSVLDRWIWLWMTWSRLTSNQRAVEADAAAAAAAAP